MYVGLRTTATVKAKPLYTMVETRRRFPTEHHPSASQGGGGGGAALPAGLASLLERTTARQGGAAARAAAAAAPTVGGSAAAAAPKVGGANGDPESEFFCDACTSTVPVGVLRWECRECPAAFVLCGACRRARPAHAHPMVPNRTAYHRTAVPAK